jgi:ABC-type uncharacterized transport system permease subunit
LKTFATYVGMVVLALLIGAILITLSGNSPLEAYSSLLLGAFSSKNRISELFVKLIPVMVMSLGVSVAFRAKLWNIGAGGQFIIGALASTTVAIYVPLPPYLMIPLSILIAMVAGGAWGALAGYLKIKWKANEVITTLMLTYIADYFLDFLMYGPMMDPAGELPQSRPVAESLRLPKLLSGYRIHAGIFIMLAVLIAMVILWRSTLGFRIVLIGQGDRVATYAGTDVSKTVVTTMFLSGAIAGIAGWMEVFGIHYRLMENLAGSYGDTATVVALLGALHPIGIAFASFFFSILLWAGRACSA